MGANIYRNKKPVLVFLVPAFLFMTIFLMGHLWGVHPNFPEMPLHLSGKMK